MWFSWYDIKSPYHWRWMPCTLPRLRMLFSESWNVRALPLLRIKLSGISGRSDSEYGTTTLCGIQLAWQLTRWRISSSGFSGPLAVRLSFQPLAESMRHPRDLCNPNLLHVLHMISAVIVWSVTRIEGFEARWSAAGPVARYSSAVASAAVPLPGTINITVFKLYRTPEFSPDPPGSDKNWDIEIFLFAECYTQIFQ